MLKRKAIIPMAAIMTMATAVSSFANEKQDNNEYNEMIYKTGEVTPQRGLNVRTTPNVDKNNKLFAASKGEELKVLGQQNDWYKVELENDKEAWVKSNYLELKNDDLYIDAHRVNFREGASLDSKVYEVLNKGTKLELLETSEKWMKVKYDGKEGYVFYKYVTNEKPVIKEEVSENTTVEVQTNTQVKPESVENNTTNNTTEESNKEESNKVEDNKVEETTKPSTENTNSNTEQKPQEQKPSQEVEKPQEDQNTETNNSNKAQAVVNSAYAQLGKPYVWGAEGPSSFDCSGLMTYIFKQGAGISLPRTSSQQSGYGTTVSRSNLQPGDLIFSSTDGSGKVSHVGVYVGNGQMIHAPKPGDVVKKTSINNSYWNNAYLWAKRVL